MMLQGLLLPGVIWAMQGGVRVEGWEVTALLVTENTTEPESRGLLNKPSCFPCLLTYRKFLKTCLLSSHKSLLSLSEALEMWRRRKVDSPGNSAQLSNYGCVTDYGCCSFGIMEGALGIWGQPCENGQWGKAQSVWTTLTSPIIQPTSISSLSSCVLSSARLSPSYVLVSFVPLLPLHASLYLLWQPFPPPPVSHVVPQINVEILTGDWPGRHWSSGGREGTRARVWPGQTDGAASISSTQICV